MNQIEFSNIIFSYLFIYCIETAFILAFTLFIRGKTMDKHNFIISVLSFSAVSYMLINFGGNSLIFRGVYIMFIWLMISLVRHYNLKQMSELARDLILAVLLMLLIEAIMFIPFIFMFGENLMELTQSVYITILLSLPTRIFEYIALQLIYIRKVEMKREEAKFYPEID